MLTLASLRSDGWTTCPEHVDDFTGLRIHGDPDDKNAIPLHSSGHASGTDLVDFVTTVHPEVLIPIHTEQPEWWDAQLAGTGVRVRKPGLGEAIVFS